MTTYTTEQIISGDIRRRTDTFRFDLLDLGGSVIGELDVDQDRPPQVQWDATGRLQRTLRSLNLTPGSQLDDIDLVSMAVRPWLILQNGTAWSLGVFRWADRTREQWSWGEAWATSLVDRSTILDQQSQWPLSAAPGWNPVQVATILALDVLGPALVAAQGSATTLAAPMSWSAGTTRLQMMTDLLAQAGFLPPYFDRNGICQIRPAPDPLTDPNPIDWPVGYPVLPGSRTRTDTLLDTPNVYVVYDSSGTGGGLRGVYRVPSTAPHSEARRGYAVPLVKGVSGLANQADADAQAYALSLSDGRSFEYQQFSSAANPLHDAWSPVLFRGERWLETKWSLICRNGGRMDHTLRRTYGAVSG